MAKTTGLGKYRRVCRNGSSNRGRRLSRAYLRPFRSSTPHFPDYSSSYPPFLNDRLVNAIMKNNSDSDSHSHLTKCSSSTIGGEKEIINNNSDSEPHSPVKVVVKDQKKEKKRKKIQDGEEGSEERKGKNSTKQKVAVSDGVSLHL
ncbi:hypothetical protein TSUD_202160 [Trifolium subterraneum]|uniref:Uncharacterized protein n=1 Tax=Trifolium subterraneum TaxID=3900 RepID=A0A2Z6MJ53_TRISU|nr:hypothetical protein TSUD_202160 [Trifolium subterraneum]